MPGSARLVLCVAVGLALPRQCGPIAAVGSRRGGTVTSVKVMVSLVRCPVGAPQDMSWCRKIRARPSYPHSSTAS